MGNERRGMGKGSVEVLPSGRVSVRWREDGKQRRQTFDTEGEAYAFLEGMIVDRRRGEYIPVDKSRMTFAEVAERWAQGLGHLRKKTRRDYLSIVNTHLKPAFGPIAMSNFDRQMVREFCTELRRTRSAATVRKCRAVLRLVFVTAIDLGAIRVNPCDGIRLKGARLPEISPVAQSDVHKIVEVINPRYRLAVLLGAFCGLRAGEIWALRREDVLFDRGQLYVRRSDSEGDDDSLEYPDEGEDEDPKTRSSRRIVPVPLAVLKALREHILQFGLGPDERIFSSPEGYRVDHHNFMVREWSWTLRQLNELYVITNGQEGMTGYPRFHDLRHTCTAYLFGCGQSVETVRRVLGHSNVVMTERYSHLFPDVFKGVAEALEPFAARAVAHVKTPRGS